MSRWGSDPEGAADQLIRRSLDDLGLQGRVLLAYTSDTLATEVARGGAAVSHGIAASRRDRPLRPGRKGTHDHALAACRSGQGGDRRVLAAAYRAELPCSREPLQSVYGGTRDGHADAAGPPPQGDGRPDCHRLALLAGLGFYRRDGPLHRRDGGNAIHVSKAAGDSGQGLTHGVMGGMLNAGLIVDGESPWAECHMFTRELIPRQRHIRIVMLNHAA